MAALLFSATVFFYNRRASKRDLFLRAHEDFAHPDRQEGRRSLYKTYETQAALEEIELEEFRIINHAVASLDFMGYLFYKGYVSRRDAYALWGITTARVYHAATESGFLALRDNQFGNEIWPYFRHFARCVNFSAQGGGRSRVPVWVVLRLIKLAPTRRGTGRGVVGIRYPEPMAKSDGPDDGG